jgi:hypothetical protein
MFFNGGQLMNASVTHLSTFVLCLKLLSLSKATQRPSVTCILHLACKLAALSVADVITDVYVS